MCLYFSVVYFDVQVQAGAHYFFLLIQYLIKKTRAMVIDDTSWVCFSN